MNHIVRLVISHRPLDAVSLLIGTSVYENISLALMATVTTSPTNTLSSTSTSMCRAGVSSILQAKVLPLQGDTGVPPSTSIIVKAPLPVPVTDNTSLADTVTLKVPKASVVPLPTDGAKPSMKISIVSDGVKPNPITLINAESAVKRLAVLNGVYVSGYPSRRAFTAAIHPVVTVTLAPVLSTAATTLVPSSTKTE